MASRSTHISVFQHVSSSCGDQDDTSVSEHNTPKAVTQSQQRATDSSLHSQVLSVDAYGGECLPLPRGEREKEG